MVSVGCERKKIVRYRRTDRHKLQTDRRLLNNIKKPAKHQARPTIRRSKRKKSRLNHCQPFLVQSFVYYDFFDLVKIGSKNRNDAQKWKNKWEEKEKKKKWEERDCNETSIYHCLGVGKTYEVQVVCRLTRKGIKRHKVVSVGYAIKISWHRRTCKQKYRQTGKHQKMIWSHSVALSNHE